MARVWNLCRCDIDVKYKQMMTWMWNLCRWWHGGLISIRLAGRLTQQWRDTRVALFTKKLMLTLKYIGSMRIVFQGQSNCNQGCMPLWSKMKQIITDLFRRHRLITHRHNCAPKLLGTKFNKSWFWLFSKPWSLNIGYFWELVSRRAFEVWWELDGKWGRSLNTPKASERDTF